jgi:hypothetical protein
MFLLLSSSSLLDDDFILSSVVVDEGCSELSTVVDVVSTVLVDPLGTGGVAALDNFSFASSSTRGVGGLVLPFFVDGLRLNSGRSTSGDVERLRLSPNRGDGLLEELLELSLQCACCFTSKLFFAMVSTLVCMETSCNDQSCAL